MITRHRHGFRGGKFLHLADERSNEFLLFFKVNEQPVVFPRPTRERQLPPKGQHDLSVPR